MPLVLDRQHVLDIYSKASEKKWVIPCFGTENLTTTEAVLSAALEYSNQINEPDIPVTIAITNQYGHRSQSVNYTHTKSWDIGLKLFLADIGVLTSEGSPFENLNVMIHLDHAQWDNDLPLFSWNMNMFSMIMYDASTLPFNENIARTADFVAKHGKEIVIEGACDEIVDATGNQRGSFTSPEVAGRFQEETGVDFLVANLGTEHRANQSDLRYHDDLARLVSEKTGPIIVLHGLSSVDKNQIRNLYDDGIAKANIWTILERDSFPVLFREMIIHASKILGAEKTRQLIDENILGNQIEFEGERRLSHYTTVYRQDLIFHEMKRIALDYFQLWYV